jgi:nicotinate-nucleotide pyrophosphorylase (carboxylating)
MARCALREDEAASDITTRSVLTVPCLGEAQLRAKQPLVVSGADIAAAVFLAQSEHLVISHLAEEGTHLAAGEVALQVSGSCSDILSSERVALNFLQHLCGIATLARHATDLVKEFDVHLLATRKTLPGLRALQRRAAEAGGFFPHRTSLGDGILIKDNHLVCSSSAGKAVRSARELTAGKFPVQVEVDRLDQLAEVIEAGAEMVLLDNFLPATVAAAVTLADGRVLLEASGGITLENLRAYAATGVQRISVGFITHSAPAADLSLDLQVTGAGHAA